MKLTAPAHRRRIDAGFSLVELMVSMTIMTAILGTTMLAMTHAMRANETAVLVTSMNNTLRTGMDLMVRDMLQVGSGLPPGHFILTPAGAGSTPVRLPGPPGSAFTLAAGDTNINAIVPGPGRGPVINGVATDTITVLTADNTFYDIVPTAASNTTVDVPAALNIGVGVDRVLPNQLMMIQKGATTTLVQVTAVNAGARRIVFTNGDSLNLNQTGAASGNLAALNATAPANTPANLRVTRVRMITYYLDTVVAGRPRLVRRINNGHPTTFNNTLGTAVAMDIENLQITYDIADGATNPANVRFVAADLNPADATGRCYSGPPQNNFCSENQIRKVNVVLTGRSREPFKATKQYFRNSLSSQVSLRGMAFVNEYVAP